MDGWQHSGVPTLSIPVGAGCRPLEANPTTISGRLIAGSIICIFLSCLALPVDVEVARHCMVGKLPGDLVKFLTISELFAHGAGILMITLTVIALDSQGGRRACRILSAAFGAGALALLGKISIGRLRPKGFQFEGTVWDTFVGWFPAWNNSDVSEIANRTIQSMPSGHTATAVALAVVMSQYYPRGRRLFFVFALLVLLQRVTSGAHFVSDTLIGAAVGLLMGSVCYHPRFLGKLFDWIESRAKADEKRPAAYRAAPTMLREFVDRRITPSETHQLNQSR